MQLMMELGSTAAFDALMGGHPSSADWMPELLLRLVASSAAAGLSPQHQQQQCVSKRIPLVDRQGRTRQALTAFYLTYSNEGELLQFVQSFTLLDKQHQHHQQQQQQANPEGRTQAAGSAATASMMR
jgi:hypothetical protein